MTKTMRINGHDYASCKVIINEYEDGKVLTLVSYTTQVAFIRFNKSGERKIACNGTYSRTTTKHIGWFAREYGDGLSYYDFKKVIGCGYVAA